MISGIVHTEAIFFHAEVRNNGLFLGSNLTFITHRGLNIGGCFLLSILHILFLLSCECTVRFQIGPQTLKVLARFGESTVNFQKIYI